jgi:hypothetical protein
MPDVDVSDLLLDPDLTDEFVVHRRTGGTDRRGVNVLWVAKRVRARGYVGPAGDNALKRLPEYQTMGKTIEVRTEFRLRGPGKTGGKSLPPDLVEWPIGSGDAFVVADVQDWSRAGSGFVTAVCSSQDFLDAPPGSSDVAPSDLVVALGAGDDLEVPA